MLKQKLSQKLLQKLSPQQIQLMKLMQVPIVLLEQRIKEELEENPVLEEGKEDIETEEEHVTDEKEDNEESSLDDDVDLTEYMSDDEVADYNSNNYKYTNRDEQQTIQSPIVKTFHESLIEQLQLLEVDERQEVLAKQLIGSIGEHGYLRRDLVAIVDDLAFSQNIDATEKELADILQLIQTLDPAGIGARNLRECLLLQLYRKKKKDKIHQLARKILEDHFDIFTKKAYSKLQTDLNISKEELRDAIDEIIKLNPKPGNAYIDNSKVREYVIPDFIINNDGNELILTLNSRNTPELKINRNYRNIIEDYTKSKKKSKKQKETIQYIKSKIDSAKWFIDALRQRQETLLNTMRAIMEHQYDYLLTSDETKFRPMKLKDIAKVTGLDISTISRVSNSKYVQTEFGTFSLKHFFSEGLVNESGEEVSTKEIKQILMDIIEKEDNDKPLTDDILKKHLEKKGYNIARRTVAKYREQLNIPVARLRKKL